MSEAEENGEMIANPEAVPEEDAGIDNLDSQMSGSSGNVDEIAEEAATKENFQYDRNEQQTENMTEKEISWEAACSTEILGAYVPVHIPEGYQPLKAIQETGEDGSVKLLLIWTNGQHQLSVKLNPIDNGEKQEEAAGIFAVYAGENWERKIPEPEEDGSTCFILLEQIIERNISVLFSLLFPINNIIPSRSVGNHRDRHFQFFLNKLNILPAVFRQLLIILNSADICLPARQLLIDRLCFGKLYCRREILCHLAVNLIANTNWQFIQISQYIQNGECYIRSALQLASITGSHSIKPSHTSWTSCGGTKFTAIATAFSQLVSLITEDFADKLARAYCTGVRLNHRDDVFDFIRRNTCADGSVGCQCGRGRYHRIDTEIRVL